MFKYVFIPADDSRPLEVREGDKSGGLSDDVLSKEAKAYFYASSDKGARAAALENATPEQRKVLADQLRNEVRAASSASPYASQMAAMDDDALIGIMRTTHTSATCEITALTVPTPLNQQRAVSIYSADDARTQNLPYNRRATELLVACGHNITGVPTPSTTSIGAAPPGGICGDAFVGRCVDDEIKDVWERVDFTIEDANPRSEWCDVARRQGGGGSPGGAGGGGGLRSLSGLMNQNAAAITAGPGAGADGGNSFREGKGDGYAWSQNDEEVELRFPVSAGTKAKYVKVNFGTSKLKVVVAGQTLLSGALGGTVDVDDSTYTIEDANSGTGKELCVTLGKKEGNTWPFVIQDG
mmetsp:Transcript_38365/g.81876  ORF Transcript_38365/g.81876 Transcript_38365/m.81876 type:complete len:354 (-) Transcript_38365:1300-2361(-)|eukprot:CAMPEP_0172565722 /NCGR_PEP_ID=MMETSP1067-20121228/109267_1 /TAXON_ID=265564 ORGANISM="Thalassiosira punctigera, Strain Tpunct2005C2" /NCGR_SAMPLE_ID=MMETSP1067 /ASSEMBLY_ACC=CAM_ASM_000444 /LENGTH=353 /DNA_ID=CAMNT_0013356669 /DNA_START=87 /DNA_END=1148 /DNA_ORIENTATION=-